MEELEALESTFAELEGAPGSSLPPLPAEFQNWHNARAARENMSRSRYVFHLQCLSLAAQPGLASAHWRAVLVAAPACLLCMIVSVLV